MPKSRRALPLVVVGLLVVPLVVVSVAFACARLATLKLNRASAGQGAVVTAVGRNFSNSADASPVAVRFNSRRGPVLWEGRPNRQGKFVATFTAPRVRAGDYVIVATQTTAEGRPAAGTPGRAPLRVRSSAARTSRSSATVELPPAGGGPGSGGGGGLPVAPVALAPLLLLLAGGAGAVLATGRRRAAVTRAPRR